MFTDIYLSALSFTDIKITPDVEKEVLEFSRKRQDQLGKEIYNEGIPEKFKTLFEKKTKSRVTKYCRKLLLTDEELFLLIYNSSQIGFRHQSKFNEFIPQHLKIRESDISNLKKGIPTKLIKKTKALFKERRRIHAHLFERDEQWHRFYYSYRDIGSNRKSHWKYGSHLHYVSYLWPNLDKEKIWASFDKRFTDIQGAIHIRLLSIDFDKS